jgi:hypothetical protein
VVPLALGSLGVAILALRAAGWFRAWRLSQPAWDETLAAFERASRRQGLGRHGQT